MKITKEIYEFALNRIEELLPLVDDNTSPKDKNAIEFKISTKGEWLFISSGAFSILNNF